MKLTFDVVENYQCRQLARSYHFGRGYHRLYLFHIRKTGGTSLNHMFLALSGEAGSEVYTRLSQTPHSRIIAGNKVFVGWNKGLIERGDYFYAFSHIPAHELKLPEGTFTITCLRDPLARILSLYAMLLEYRNNNVPHPMMEKQGQWLGSSFSDFLARIPPEHLLRQLYMFSRNFSPDEAFDTIAGCSHFFVTEMFASGAEALAVKLNLELKPAHAKKSSFRPDLSTQDLEQLRSRLEPEFLLYEKIRKELLPQ